MFDYVRRHKLLSIAIILNIIAILIVVLFVVIHKSKTAVVDIYVVPSEAVVELNGKKFDNFASHNLAPGDYHVKISMEGMQTQEYDLTLGDDEFARIWKYLVSNDRGLDYYLDNPDELLFLRKFSDDKDAKSLVEYYDKVVSIRDVLPLEYYERFDSANMVGVFVEEDMGECENELLCLVVYGGERNRDIALDLIREAGYEPDNYKIRFEGE